MKCVEKDGLPEPDDTRLFWVWGKNEDAPEGGWPAYAWHYPLDTYRLRSWEEIDGRDMRGVTHYQAIDVPEPETCEKCGEPVEGKRE